jgi:amino-acid N-acetyltransferase
MLPRPYAQVMEKIRDFVVAVDERVSQPSLKGIVAMHVVGEDLAEIRSLAVDEALQGKGIGKKLLEFCLKDAHELQLRRVFALTYQTQFFDKLGFHKVEKLTLPQKIWGDCVHCAKFSDCDEIAMILNIGKP